GYAKQGTGYGYSGVKGLNAQVATVSTLQAAPVIAGIRLRRGAAASAHGTATMIGSALATAKRAGVTGLVTVRADSAYFQHATVTAARRGGAHFSITARMNPSVVAAISRIPEQAWVGIKYPKAIFDQDQQRWISDAEVAEIDYTAFTSRTKKEHVTARLIVRRVKRLNPRHGHGEQGGLLDAYRHHAVFTDSPLSMLAAEASHRDHAIVEQVIADLKNGPLAHCPSGVFTANSAWTVLAAIAFNLARAAGVLASTFHARARWQTLLDHLIAVPARIANRARSWRLHLPRNWPWQSAWKCLFHAPVAAPTMTSPAAFCPYEQDPKWKLRADRQLPHTFTPEPVSPLDRNHRESLWKPNRRIEADPAAGLRTEGGGPGHRAAGTGPVLDRAPRGPAQLSRTTRSHAPISRLCPCSMRGAEPSSAPPASTEHPATGLGSVTALPE